MKIVCITKHQNAINRTSNRIVALYIPICSFVVLFNTNPYETLSRSVLSFFFNIFYVIYFI